MSDDIVRDSNGLPAKEFYDEADRLGICTVPDCGCIGEAHD